MFKVFAFNYFTKRYEELSEYKTEKEAEKEAKKLRTNGHTIVYIKKK